MLGVEMDCLLNHRVVPCFFYSIFVKLCKDNTTMRFDEQTQGKVHALTCLD